MSNYIIPIIRTTLSERILVPDIVNNSIPIQNEPAFVGYNKITRLYRDCTITEKIDGTNGQIFITKSGEVLAASRTRWLQYGKLTDNYGFATWVEDHKEELLKLGEGRHYGEWFGQGIQRKYGLNEKRFYLFDTHKWGTDNPPPSCCGVVPIIGAGKFETPFVNSILDLLREHGSFAVPGYMNPEGIVIRMNQSGHLYKVTLENDEEPKSRSKDYVLK